MEGPDTHTRIAGTLEQWRMAVAVADVGGFAAAARRLNKSQSAISHGVAELSARLGVVIFEIHGREAKLTDGGAMLLRRARRLLDDARQLETVAATIASGQEVNLTIAVDAIVPMAKIVEVLRAFGDCMPETRVEVQEVVLSGILDIMETGIPRDAAMTSGATPTDQPPRNQVSMALSSIEPPGLIAVPLFPVEFIGVAHPGHALHQLGRELDNEDLKHHRHLVVRDTGRRRYDAGMRGSEQRWTFSNHASSAEALKAGQGFSWFPKARIERELSEGTLKPLPMRDGNLRRAVIKLVHRERDNLGPAANRLIDLFLSQREDGIDALAANVILLNQ